MNAFDASSEGLLTSSPFVFQVKDTSGQVVQIPDTNFVNAGDANTLSASQTYSDTVVTNYLETLVPDWIYPPVQEYCLEYFNGQSWSLIATRDYTDQSSASAFASAKVHSDAALNTAKTELRSYADGKLQEAKVYAVTQDGIILDAAKAYARSLGGASKQYVDDQDALYLGYAQSYARGRDTVVLNDSKQYTDQRIAEIALENFTFEQFLGYMDQMDAA